MTAGAKSSLTGLATRSATAIAATVIADVALVDAAVAVVAGQG